MAFDAMLSNSFWMFARTIANLPKLLLLFLSFSSNIPSPAPALRLRVRLRRRDGFHQPPRRHLPRRKTVVPPKIRSRTRCFRSHLSSLSQSRRFQSTRRIQTSSSSSSHRCVGSSCSTRRPGGCGAVCPPCSRRRRRDGRESLVICVRTLKYDAKNTPSRCRHKNYHPHPKYATRRRIIIEERHWRTATVLFQQKGETPTTAGDERPETPRGGTRRRRHYSSFATSFFFFFFFSETERTRRQWCPRCRRPGI